MHSLLKENLEALLSRTLKGDEREAVEAHLAGCAECRAEHAQMAASADWIRQLRPPQEAELEPSPGFYARVVDRIEHERAVPFWAMLVESAMGRQVALACLMLLAVLGAYVAAFDAGDYPSRHRPEAMLAARQAPPVPTPRLGPNLNRNREVMLATLVSGD